MLRAIFKRSIKLISGGICESFETIDIDCPEIEKRMGRGGASEDAYDITEFIGFEVKS